jgi:hypothetical protein
MSEIFNSFLKNIYIPAREKTKSFFLMIRTPIRIIKNIIFSAFIVYAIFNYSKIIETFIPNVFKFITAHTWESAIVLFILLTIKKYLASYAQNLFSTLTNKYFMLSLAVLAIAGASAALFIPSYTNWFRENDSAKSQQMISSSQPTQSGQDTGNQQKQESKNSASELRGHLLYITGGVIAVLGLIETNRKNSQDHIRQVHAARRERYIEAVDKLSSEQAPVRLGGVYALVGLVDEWLDDNNIDKETRIKEGQIIINNLCSYIRSPFPLAEKIEDIKRKKPKSLSPLGFLRLDFLNKYFIDSNIEQITADYAKFHEEQDIRRTIFVEMSKRSSTFTKNRKGKVVKTASGTWSEFDFDFSRAPIFYPLDFLTIEKGRFRSAKFHSSASCVETTFAQNAHFMQTTIAQDVYFTRAFFAQDVYFAWATFTQNAYFAGATFTQYVNFMGATFTNNVDFSNSIFETDEPTFARENYRARFGIQDGPEDYKFSVRSGSKPIQLGKAELDAVKRWIPVGAVLVDPDSGRTSDPAK